jgi:hypothetical protein
MTAPYLSLEDEHYCQLRAEGCEPVYAARKSRRQYIHTENVRVAAINEASRMIQEHIAEITFGEFLVERSTSVRDTEEATHVKGAVASLRLPGAVDDPHPFEGLQTLVLKD